MNNFISRNIPDCFRDENDKFNDRLIGFSLLEIVGLQTMRLMADSLVNDPCITSHSITLFGKSAYEKLSVSSKSHADVLERLHKKEGDDYCTVENLGEDNYKKLCNIKSCINNVLIDNSLLTLTTGIGEFALSSCLKPFLTASDRCRLFMTCKPNETSMSKSENNIAASSPS